MCKNKCHYRVIDNIQVHIIGEVDAETQAAIENMVKVAKNYSFMKKKLKEKRV